jgi:hypothetical protein
MEDVMSGFLGERVEDFKSGLSVLHERGIRTITILESAFQQWDDGWGIRNRMVLRERLLADFFRGEIPERFLVQLDMSHREDEHKFREIEVIVTETTQGRLSETTQGRLSLLSTSVTTLRRIAVDQVALIQEMLNVLRSRVAEM